MNESAPTVISSEHEHRWRYLFGQGSIHRCTICHVIGHRVWDGKGTVEAKTCDYIGCEQPALMHGWHGLSCKDHSDEDLIGHKKPRKNKRI